MNHDDAVDIRDTSPIEEGTIEKFPVATEVHHQHIDPPDGGYGWVVALSSCFVQLFVLGNVYLFGVLYPVYIDEFDSTQSETAWIGSIGASLITAFGMIVGGCTDYYGNGTLIFVGALMIFTGYILASYSTELWHLYVTQGFICGAGFSCAFIPAVGAVGQWFSKKRGVALGLALGGSGLGQIVFVFSGGSMIRTFGWRGTLRALAVINFVGLSILSLLIKRFLPLKSTIEINASWKMFFNPTFLTLYVSVVLNSLGVLMPVTFLIIYALDHGISRSSAVFISAVSGSMSIIGRISCGLIADRFGKIFILKLFMYGTGITTFCWLACTTFPSILIFSLIFAYFAGASISLIPAVCAEVFGVESLGSVMGLLYSAQAVGNLLCSPFAGFLHDKTHNYTVPIVVAGSFLISGAGLLFLLPGVIPCVSSTPSPDCSTKSSFLSPPIDSVDTGIPNDDAELATIDSATKGTDIGIEHRDKAVVRFEMIDYHAIEGEDTHDEQSIEENGVSTVISL